MNYLVFNIETIPEPELPAGILPAMEDIEAPSTYKDPQKIMAYKADKLNELREMASLSPLTARIIALSLSYDDTITTKVVGRDADDESQLIALFWQYLQARCKNVQGVLVGYNSKSFDYLHLVAGAVRYGIPIYDCSPWDYMSKYNQGYHFDVYAFLSNFERVKGKLGEWSLRMGVNPPYGKGKYVSEWWRDGKLEDIANHCASNVRATKEIFLRIISTTGVPRI